MKHLIVTSVLVLNAAACGNSSNSSDKAAEQPSVAAANAIPVAESSPAANGTKPEAPAIAPVEAPSAPASVTLEIDATHKTEWAHFDLDTGKIVAATDASWDLAFKRTSIKLNAETVTALKSDATDFDAILAAPESGFTTDLAVAGAASETNGLFFHAGDGWYVYDMNVHVINSRGAVYVVKSNAGLDYKLSILDYYNADRLPAFIQLKFQQFLVPAAPAAAE